MNLGPNIILDSKQNFETLIMVSGKKTQFITSFFWFLISPVPQHIKLANNNWEKQKDIGSWYKAHIKLHLWHSQLKLSWYNC